MVVLEGGVVSNEQGTPVGVVWYLAVVLGAVVLLLLLLDSRNRS